MKYRYVAALLCALLLVPLCARSQDVNSTMTKSVVIGVSTAGALKFSIPETLMMEKMTAALRGGCDISAVRIEVSGSHVYLIGDCVTAANKGLVAFELDVIGGKALLSMGSEVVICTPETCTACRFKKGRNGQIILCQSAAESAEGICSISRDKAVVERLIDLLRNR